MAGEAGRGTARSVEARRGAARQARHGTFGLGETRQGRQGLTGRGESGQGRTRPGKAWKNNNTKIKEKK